MLNTQKTEKYRIMDGGSYSSTSADGPNGAFRIKYLKRQMVIIISDGEGWEHVSVSAHKTPHWGMMCYVKSLFWLPEDQVIQYHPPESDYINCHPHCLHLWRPIGQIIPCPPSLLVGPKGHFYQ